MLSRAAKSVDIQLRNYWPCKLTLADRCCKCKDFEENLNCYKDIHGVTSPLKLGGILAFAYLYQCLCLCVCLPILCFFYQRKKIKQIKTPYFFCFYIYPTIYACPLPFQWIYLPGKTQDILAGCQCCSPLPKATGHILQAQSNQWLYPDPPQEEWQGHQWWIVQWAWLSVEMRNRFRIRESEKS